MRDYRFRSGVRIALVFALLCLAGAAGCSGGGSPPNTGLVHFVPNSHAFWSNRANWTTPLGPAYADITTASSNFVPCLGGPFALCYYSGPSGGNENLSCTVTPDGLYANCRCFQIPYGVFFVDINAILNLDVYRQTVAQCGADGSLCATLNTAPVCQSVNDGTLIPGSSVYSAFSFDCVPTDGLGQTNCVSAPYAGCMTAPCFPTDKPGIVECSCPVFNGLFQVGQNGETCSLGGNLVWSAAFAPTPTPAPTPAQSTRTGTAPMSSILASTVPNPPSCLPDAPGNVGCPLFVPGSPMLPPASGVDCHVVCQEYTTCLSGGVQAGFTCDSTLCTDQCNDLDLVDTACSGLTGCDISEIVKAETAAQCSCCASQLCGCNPDAATNAEIFKLDQQQRDRGIKPQCDINGTLCGGT